MNDNAFLVNNDSVTVVLGGKVASGPRDVAERNGVLAAIIAGNLQKAFDLLDRAKAVAVKSFGKFTVSNGQVMFNGQAIHNAISERVLEFLDAGLPFEPLLKFQEKIFSNPSKRAQDEGYKFLEHRNLPLTEDGCFLAYKSVASDYLSKASGTEPVEVSTDGGRTFQTFVGRIPNNVGNIVRMNRGLVDDDFRNECSKGLHVGCLSYSGPDGWYHSSGDKIVIVKIDPKDIVSVPNDHNATKMRVSQYTVLQDFQGAYDVPVTNATGNEFEGETESQVVCTNCDFEGLFADLIRGYRCPDCGLSTYVFDVNDPDFLLT
jgi:hypothetical protein